MLEVFTVHSIKCKSWLGIAFFLRYIPTEQILQFYFCRSIVAMRKKVISNRGKKDRGCSKALLTINDLDTISIFIINRYQ